MKTGQNLIDYLVEIGLIDRHWMLVDFVIAIEAAKAFPVYKKIEDDEKVGIFELNIDLNIFRYYCWKRPVS